MAQGLPTEVRHAAYCPVRDQFHWSMTEVMEWLQALHEEVGRGENDAAEGIAG